MMIVHEGAEGAFGYTFLCAVVMLDMTNGQVDEGL